MCNIPYPHSHYSTNSGLLMDAGLNADTLAAVLIFLAAGRYLSETQTLSFLFLIIFCFFVFLFSHETQQTYRAVLTGIRKDPYCSGKIIIKVQQHRFIPTQQVHNNEHTFIHLIRTRGNQCSKKPCKCFKKL